MELIRGNKNSELDSLSLVSIVLHLPHSPIMSAPPRKPPAKARTSLVDAAKTAPKAAAPAAAPTPAPAPLARTPSASAPGPSVRSVSRPGSAGSTPTPSLGDTPQVIPRMKFKPKVPARRVVKAYVPLISSGSC
jgi:hypothetical protein